MEEVVGSSHQADDDDGGTLIHWLAAFVPSQVDYFAQAASLLKGEAPLAPQPYQTFAVKDAAFHLSRDPAMWHLVIDDIAKTFDLPDLPAALAQYVCQLTAGHHFHPVGGHQAPATGPLPFGAADVWATIHIQGKAYDYPHSPLPPQTVNASTPSLLTGWQHGCHNPVIINVDPSKWWPRDGLKGKLTSPSCWWSSCWFYI